MAVALIELYQTNDQRTFNFAKETFFETCPKLKSYWELLSEMLPGVDNFEKSRNSIKLITTLAMDVLDQNIKNKVYGKIYEIEKPVTTDPKWGENNAFKDIPRLISVINSFAPFEDLCEKNIETVLKRNFYIKSPCYYQLENRSDIYEKEIGYVNGIGTSLDHAKWDAYRLSDNLCKKNNIHGIWNATQGFLEDLIISVQLMHGSSPEPIRLLIDQWKGFFNNTPPDATYLQICHSQGALMVRNAMAQIEPSIRKRIRVIAVGPACFIPPEEGVQVRHFVKRGDIIPTRLALGKERLNHEDPEIIIVPDNDGSDPHDANGLNYQAKLRPYIEKYLAIGSII